MSKTVGDFLFERIAQWGVKRVFGYPGDEDRMKVLGRLYRQITG